MTAAIAWNRKHWRWLLGALAALGSGIALALARKSGKDAVKGSVTKANRDDLAKAATDATVLIQRDADREKAARDAKAKIDAQTADDLAHPPTTPEDAIREADAALARADEMEREDA